MRKRHTFTVSANPSEVRAGMSRTNYSLRGDRPPSDNLEASTPDELAALVDAWARALEPPTAPCNAWRVWIEAPAGRWPAGFKTPFGNGGITVRLADADAPMSVNQ